MTRGALIAAQVFAAIAIAACAYAVFGRLGYDCELEWMTGAIFDHIERMRAGKPIYTAPSVEWTPFLYPPLYYALVARLSGVLSTAMAARAISIAATFGSAACIWRLARRHGASRPWCVVALGLFAAAFGDTSYWYDLERVDPLFVAMMGLGVVLLVESDRLATTALSGVVMGLGFFAKQPAAMFLAGAFAGLVIRREPRRAAAFAVPAGLVIVVGVAWLEKSTGGWFGYYVLKMPSAHGVMWSLFRPLVLEDIPRAFALVGAVLVFVTTWARRRLEKSDAILACTVGASAVASGWSRVHFGGWDNVLMFFLTFACPVFAIVATRLQERWGEQRGFLWVPAAAGVQMLAWAYDPTSAIPPRVLVPEARAFERRVRELEKDGDVVITGRGNVSTLRHAHQAALIDVFRAEKKIPDEIARAFRERRFAAIIIDNFDDLQLTFLPGLNGKLFNVVLANYYVAERLPYWMPDAPVGFHTHPRLVLRRRSEVLDEASPELVRCRAKIERVVAETRERAKRGGATSVATPDIEAVARETCARGLDGVDFPKGFWVDDDLVSQ